MEESKINITIINLIIALIAIKVNIKKQQVLKYKTAI